MYAASFEYHRPDSVGAAIELLGRYPDDSKLLAGGHSLIPLMKLRFAQPGHVIDISRIAGLKGVREADGEVVVGALTTYSELESSALVRTRVPLLAEAASQVGDLQVRNRGTLGGSLAHADPGADMPAVILALDARIVAMGPGGERILPAESFFTGLMSTALEPEEVITAVRLPGAGATGSAYEKVRHPASGYALCGAAAVITLDGGRVGRVRLGLTGIASHAARAVAAEQELVGREPTPEALRAAADRVVEGLSLRADPPGADGYNAHLARTTARRALERAVARLQG